MYCWIADGSNFLNAQFSNRVNFSDPQNGFRYDNRCITKLVANFRSHKEILEIPSKLFYKGELFAKGDPVIIDSMTQWEHLPKKGSPIIFHGIFGQDKRELRSPSYFNPEEVACVVDYVDKLLSTKQKVGINLLVRY